MIESFEIDERVRTLAQQARHCAQAAWDRARSCSAMLAQHTLALGGWIARHPKRRLMGASAAAVFLAISAGGVGAALAGLGNGASALRPAVSDLSPAGFSAHIRGMDGAMLALAQRFDQPGRLGRLQDTSGPSDTPDRLAGMQTVSAADDESPVFHWQQLSPEQARLINASLPVSTTPNPAAKPFILKADSQMESLRALDCMTAAVYYEAAKESDAGQAAVAQVVLNRMRHAAYPKTVCGVVFQGSEKTTSCQFSFTCDGSLARPPIPALWARAEKNAAAALNGYVMKAVGNATHYHAVYVAPYWMPNLVKVATVGAHVFYRWDGGWGRPAAFTAAYGAHELDGMPNTNLAFLTPVKMEKLSSGEAPKAAAPQIAAAPAPLENIQSAEAAAVPVIAIAPAVPAPSQMIDPFKGATAPKVNSRLAIPSGGSWQP